MGGKKDSDPGVSVFCCERKLPLKSIQLAVIQFEFPNIVMWKWRMFPKVLLFFFLIFNLPLGHLPHWLWKAFWSWPSTLISLHMIVAGVNFGSSHNVCACQRFLMNVIDEYNFLFYIWCAAAMNLSTSVCAFLRSWRRQELEHQLEQIPGTKTVTPSSVFNTEWL